MRWLVHVRDYDSSAGANDPQIQMQVRDLAALIARGLRVIFAPLKREGAGNAGCTLHPRSRVRFAQNKVHTSIQGSGGDPTFPAQWLYGLYRTLPGERAFLPPSSLISVGFSRT